MLEALAILRARLAKHRSAGRVAQAAECQRCIEAIRGVGKKVTNSPRSVRSEHCMRVQPLP